MTLYQTADQKSKAQQTRDALMQVKVVINHLKGIDQQSLTQREREVWQECCNHSYDQASALLADFFQLLPISMREEMMSQIHTEWSVPDEQGDQRW